MRAARGDAAWNILRLTRPSFESAIDREPVRGDKEFRQMEHSCARHNLTEGVSSREEKALGFRRGNTRRDQLHFPGREYCL